MAHEGGYYRFFMYLSLFCFSMLNLVLADNLFQIFVSWELVGICSYLLIGFYYERQNRPRTRPTRRSSPTASATPASSSACSSSRLFGTFNFVRVTDVAGATGNVDGEPPRSRRQLLLFIGATGKSAQIPLYIWLPDAMEGPTPVSALIHAATMVTAGVYMVARSNALFALSPWR